MQQQMSPVAILSAGKREHLVPVLSLLRAASLPTEGVEEHFHNFLVGVDPAGNIVGAIGMEQYPDGTGLLRSAVVEPSFRNTGIGSMLEGDKYVLLVTDGRFAADVMVERSRGKCLVTIPDVDGGSDTAAGLRGPAQLCTDLYDHPDRVRTLIEASGHEVMPPAAFRQQFDLEDGKGRYGRRAA